MKTFNFPINTAKLNNLVQRNFTHHLLERFLRALPMSGFIPWYLFTLYTITKQKFSFHELSQ